MECRIIRITPKSTDAQVGMFLVNGEPKYLTLELPWLDNAKNISCIPVGEYECKKVFNRTFGVTKLLETFEVLNVPDRSGILIHPGNEPKDTRGCILMGNRILDKEFITGSKVAFDSFINDTMLNINHFKLKIEHHEAL